MLPQLALLLPLLVLAPAKPERAVKPHPPTSAASHPIFRIAAEPRTSLQAARQEPRPPNARKTHLGSPAKPASAAKTEHHASGAGAKDFRANLAWQIALERVGFSPGVIDGAIGQKTQMATREFQRVRGLPATGRLDDATRAALAIDPENAVTTYIVTQGDLAEVGPVPTDWNEKSKLPRLKYESLDAALAEKFHCSRSLLARLNPGRNLGTLQPGDAIQVPNVEHVVAALHVEQLEINLAEKTVRAMDRDKRLVALFHCSIAKSKDKLPRGESKVMVVSKNPNYTFDPKMWPEVKNVDRKLTIPPGPRNPVGLCWIGLGLPGVGIHGSPAPEMIGKTGSHGCFRLTNWDALRLSAMVRVGTRVQFVG